jgi:hypothetical protein
MVKTTPSAPNIKSLLALGMGIALQIVREPVLPILPAKIKAKREMI